MTCDFVNDLDNRRTQNSKFLDILHEQTSGKKFIEIRRMMYEAQNCKVQNLGMKQSSKLLSNLHSNSVITNSLGPATYVRYNRVNLCTNVTNLP